MTNEPLPDRRARDTDPAPPPARPGWLDELNDKMGAVHEVALKCFEKVLEIEAQIMSRINDLEREIGARVARVENEQNRIRRRLDALERERAANADDGR